MLFDAGTVKDAATYEEPTRPAEGIHTVIVNGGVAWEGGRSTGVRRGRVLRRTPSRRAPAGAGGMSAAGIQRYPTPLPVPFSKAVRAGDFLFLSGVLAMDAQARIVEGDVQAQRSRVPGAALPVADRRIPERVVVRHGQVREREGQAHIE